MEVIGVEVDDVEVLRAPEDLLQLDQRVEHPQRLAPQRALDDGYQPAEVRESPVAKRVTRWPWRTSSSVSQETTRSVPP